MTDTKERSTDAERGDLSLPGGSGYAYWAGRLSVAVEIALTGTPTDRRVAWDALAAYRAAVAATVAK